MPWIRLQAYARPLCLSFVLSGAAGCTLVDTHVDVVYPPSAATTVPGASGTSVAVSVIDERTDHRDRVGTYPKTTGTGALFVAVAAASGPGVIIANQDVPDLVAKAVSGELAARGFALAPGGARLQIGLGQFYETTDHVLLGVKTSATVLFDVKVRAPSGKTFERNYSDTVTDSYTWSTTENAIDRLQQAFHNAVQKAVTDPDLQNALTTARAG